jgi:hypothetical protein
MSAFHGFGAEGEGRRGSTIDSEQRGCYLGIPQNPGHPADRPSVTINPVSTKAGAVQVTGLPNRRCSSSICARQQTALLRA